LRIKQAFFDMMEKTGISPFGDGLRGTLRAISMEQDFATFGDDYVIGSTTASAVAGFIKILNRVAELTKETEEKIRELKEQIKEADDDRAFDAKRLQRMKNDLNMLKYDIELLNQEGVFYRALLKELG